MTKQTQPLELDLIDKWIAAIEQMSNVMMRNVWPQKVSRTGSYGIGYHAALKELEARLENDSPLDRDLARIWNEATQAPYSP